MRRNIGRAKKLMESAGYEVIKESESTKDSMNYHELDKLYSKKKYFKDRYKESGNMKDLIDDLAHKGIKYTIYDDVTDNGCTVFYESVRNENINEAVTIGDTLTYEGRPCIVAFIDDEDEEALLKFTDGKDPKKQFVSLSALESSTDEDDPKEDTESPEADKDSEAEELRAKYAEVIERVDASDPIVDQLQTLFDGLVPSRGPADTVAGEMVRAMMRLLYRDYNDGDKFYEGYGLETCAPSAAYLGYEWETDDLFNKLEDIAETVPNMPEDRGDAYYTQSLEDIAEMIINRVMKGNDFVKNTKDSREEDISEIKELEPKYDWDFEIPWEVSKHLEAGNISKSDLEYEIENWDSTRGLEFSIEGDYIYFSEISRDERDRLEDEFENNLEYYGRDLDNEYGDPEDEEDED